MRKSHFITITLSIVLLIGQSLAYQGDRFGPYRKMAAEQGKRFIEPGSDEAQEIYQRLRREATTPPDPERLAAYKEIVERLKAAQTDEERIAIGTAAPPEMGRFVDPASLEGREFINRATAMRIVKIYQDQSLTPAEKNRRSKQAARDAGGHFIRRMSATQSGECVGGCAIWTFIAGGECVLTCQQMVCSDCCSIFIYSVTTLYCPETGFTNFGPSMDGCPGCNV